MCAQLSPGFLNADSQTGTLWDNLPLDLVPCQRSPKKVQGPRLGLRGPGCWMGAVDGPASVMST